MMKYRLPTFLLILLFLLFGQTTGHGEESTKPKLPQRLEQILTWLPGDTETLVVANGPFKLPRELRDERTTLESAQSLAFGYVVLLQDGLLSKQLAGQNVLTAVLASRRFTSPKGLGMMPFEGCQILQFDNSAEEALRAAVKRCLETAPRTIQVGETKVAVFKQRFESDEWSFFIAQPRDGVLLCATNQKFLEEVVARIHRGQADRAFPDDLPEWQHVNFESPVWALRHYHQEFAETDPSSPLNDGWGSNTRDCKATGFVCCFTANPIQAARVRYLSGAKDLAKLVKPAWHFPMYHLTPTVEEVRPGVVELTARLSDKDESGAMFLFVLMGYLGHAVYL